MAFCYHCFGARASQGWALHISGARAGKQQRVLQGLCHPDKCNAPPPVHVLQPSWRAALQKVTAQVCRWQDTAYCHNRMIKAMLLGKAIRCIGRRSLAQGFSGRLPAAPGSAAAGEQIALLCFGVCSAGLIAPQQIEASCCKQNLQPAAPVVLKKLLNTSSKGKRPSSLPAARKRRTSEEMV